MDEEPQAEPQKKPRGRPFEKGNSANPHGRRGKPVLPTEGTLYDNMKRVFEQPESEDRTAGEKHCRVWLNDNPKQFLAELSRLRGLELEAEIAAARQPTETVPEKDERQQKIEDILDDILREIGAA